jgi:uncharacterized DUF497 family protein
VGQQRPGKAGILMGHGNRRDIFAACIYIYGMMTWDENKRQCNIFKHGIDFRGAETIFDYPMLTREDDREYNDGEQRLQSLGLLQGRIVFVVWVERNTGAHIISIRKAQRHEQKIYLQATDQ